jgi:hypothetical protein
VFERLRDGPKLQLAVRLIRLIKGVPPGVAASALAGRKGRKIRMLGFSPAWLLGE